MQKRERKILKMSKKAQKLLKKTKLAVENNEDSWVDYWEILYNKIFSEKFSLKLRDKYNLYLDYCDPDTTYEEDVVAYINALNYYCETRLKDS